MLPLDLCSGISLGPDLCPRILLGPDVSVLFHGPDLWSSVSHNLCWGILYGLCLGILCGLYGPDLCPCIFLGYPSLELLEQGFRRWWLTDFRLTLAGGFGSGSDFVAGRRVPCGGLVV